MSITEGGDRLVIDPGVWSPSFTDFSSITALIITHVHQDHLDIEKVKAIIAATPKLPIYTTSQVAKELPDSSVIVPEVGNEYEAGAFKLVFYGGQHATIRPSWPTDENFGVLVNSKLYFPGDSFTQIDASYEWLALPTDAPWAKVDETASFLEQSTAKKVFPVHNAILSEVGQGLYDTILGGVCEQTGKIYQFVKPGESIEI